MTIPAFLPTRLIPATWALRHARRVLSACSATSPSPHSLSARERRRVAEIARIKTHRAIAAEVAANPDSHISIMTILSREVIQRCGLPHRLARVRVMLSREDVISSDSIRFKKVIREGLIRLFPEVAERGPLRPDDEFDVRVVRTDDNTPQYVHVIPHSLPPPPPPPSDRMLRVKTMGTKIAADSTARLAMISFYKFVQLSEPDLVVSKLQKIWGRMAVTGRVYVASEGVNAQLAVPEMLLSDFRDAMSGAWEEHEKTVIPKELVGVFLNVDRIVTRSEQPFEKLHVRARDKILADGLSAPLDWQRAGREVGPKEWHDLVGENGDDVVVLDCRNDYESDVGRFEGAQPLNTHVFRDSWNELEQRLGGENRNKQILTYCTGGIRCVKVNAFLEQNMGFTNVGRLEGGIVSYARHLREEGRIEESKFKGVNHVFDGRMGEVITDDLLDRCLNCQTPCNIQTDCANVTCPRPFDKRVFVQCEECAARLSGACCEECHTTVKAKTTTTTVTTTTTNSTSTTTGDVISESTTDETFAKVKTRVQSDSERYADHFCGEEPALLAEVRARTARAFPSRALMVSSFAQASLLQLLIQVSDARRVLEIGTFTGYATIAMAMAVPADGEVITLELDEKAATIAKELIGKDDRIAEKVEVKLGKAIDIIGELSSGKESFDLVFIDADKGGYKMYVQQLLETNLLRKGGLVVCDNVLFRGEVAEVWMNEDGTNDNVESDLARKRVRSLRQARRTARKLHEFNDYVRAEGRLDQVVLAFGDGVTVARRVR